MNNGDEANNCDEMVGVCDEKSVSCDQINQAGQEVGHILPIKRFPKVFPVP